MPGQLAKVDDNWQLKILWQVLYSIERHQGGHTEPAFKFFWDLIPTPPLSCQITGELIHALPELNSS